MKDQYCCETPHTSDTERAECVLRVLAAVSSIMTTLEADFSHGLLELLDLSSNRFDSDLVLRGYLMDLSRTVQVSDRALQNRVSNSYDLVNRYPKLFDLHTRGSVSAGVASAIVQAGTGLWNIPTCRECGPVCACGFSEQAKVEMQERTDEFQNQVCEFVVKPGVNVSAAKRYATRLAESLMDEPLQKRQEETLREMQSCGLKQVEVAQGVIENRFVTSAVEAYALKSRLKKVAKLKKEAETERPGTRQDKTIGSLEVETLLQMLNGDLDNVYKGVQGEIGVIIPVETLMNNTELKTAQHLLLEGYGPVAYDDSVFNVLAGATSWDRIFTDSLTGQVLASDSYQPTAAQKRLLKYRDYGCRWSGCGAQRHDIDHTVPWSEGGKTSIENLSQLCRRHHTAKHHSGWQLKQLKPGVLEWKSPTGKIYVDEPHAFQPETVKPKSSVRFRRVPEGIPPPF